MYSRFDTEARIAVAQATDLARELGHSQVGPDHLLLGLLANMRGTAYAALADHGLRLEAARDLVVTQHLEPDRDEQRTDAGVPDDTDRLEEDREAQVEALRILARVLMPFAPHIAEELLIASHPEGAGEIDATWPASELVPR